MTSTCVMDQVVQTHLLISKIDVNRIIQTCDSLVNNQNTTVNQLISLFCKISGCDSYCQQMVSLCNQILSDTVTSSNDVVNMCKSLKPIDLSPDEPDTYLVVEHVEGPGSLTSVEPSNQIAKEPFLCPKNVKPSILKPPVARSKHKPSISKRTKPQITIATSKPNITIPTSQPELPILTNSPELHIATSQPELPIDTSHPEIIIETGQPELIIPTATSQPELPIDTSHPEFIIEIGQPELLVPIATSQPKPSISKISKPQITIATSKPNITIPTSQPELPILTNSPELHIATSQPELPIDTSHPEIIIETGQPELLIPIATSQPELPIDTSHPEIIIEIGQPELLVPIATSQPKPSKPNIIETSQPELPIATSQSKSSILTRSKSNITIATNEPEIPTSKSNSESTSKPMLPITISKSESLKIINNPQLHPPSSQGKLSSNRNNSKSSTIVQTLKNATDSETIKAIDSLIQNNANLLQSNLVSKRKPLLPKSKHKHKVFSNSSEHRPKPCERYICNICEKIFTRGSLKKHKLTHLDHKPVACPQCDYRCVSQNYLTAHLQRHNREKNYQCEKCGKFFKRTANLRRHKLTHSVTKKEIML